MKLLASRIEYELQERGQTHCPVFEHELQRVWRLNQKDRESKIAQFAKEHGLRLRFYKKGVCAIFDRRPRGQGDVRTKLL
jgi:hypothetical protein